MKFGPFWYFEDNAWIQFETDRGVLSRVQLSVPGKETIEHNDRTLGLCGDWQDVPRQNWPVRWTVQVHNQLRLKDFARDTTSDQLYVTSWNRNASVLEVFTVAPSRVDSSETYKKVDGFSPFKDIGIDGLPVEKVQDSSIVPVPAGQLPLTPEMRKALAQQIEEQRLRAEQELDDKQDTWDALKEHENGLLPNELMVLSEKGKIRLDNWREIILDAIVFPDAFSLDAINVVLINCQDILENRDNEYFKRINQASISPRFFIDINLTDAARRNLQMEIHKYLTGLVRNKREALARAYNLLPLPALNEPAFSAPKENSPAAASSTPVRQQEPESAPHSDSESSEYDGGPLGGPFEDESAKHLSDENPVAIPGTGQQASQVEAQEPSPAPKRTGNWVPMVQRRAPVSIDPERKSGTNRVPMVHSRTPVPAPANPADSNVLVSGGNRRRDSDVDQEGVLQWQPSSVPIPVTPAQRFHTPFPVNPANSEDRLGAILEALAQAQENYQTWYSSSTKNGEYRGKHGFFSKIFLHTQKGQRYASTLVDDCREIAAEECMSTDQKIKAISGVINAFLVEPGRKYNGHSFSNVALSFLNQIQRSDWSGILPKANGRFSKENTVGVLSQLLEQQGHNSNGL